MAASGISFLYVEALPARGARELQQEIRSAAQWMGLSMADIMRQSMKAGLPKAVEQFGRTTPKPLTAEEARIAYQTPNLEFDDLERHCARLPKRHPRE